MKLVTFEIKTVLGRFLRAGALVHNATKVVDLNAAYAWQLAEEGEAQPQRLADVILPSQMNDLIAMGDRALDAAQGVVEQFEKISSDPPLGLNEATLLFSLKEANLRVPFQPNSFRDFFAFEQHVSVGYKLRNEPIPEAWYKLPVYYKGNHRSVVGPDEPLQWPSYTRKLDYELEFGCVIGKAGRNLSPEQAERHILGYTIVNDFSARDIQKYEMQCRLGPAKGKDFATAVGPCIVTKDELPDINPLEARAFINGKLLSKGVFKDCHFSFAEMISHWSQEESIYPGDLIASGTVGTGCGLENGTWLQPGDEILLEIDGIGQLRNKILPPVEQKDLMEAFQGKVSKMAPSKP